MTMQTQNPDAAHSLYVLYQTLSDEAKQLFIQELLENQDEKIENHLFYLACKQAKQDNEFLDDTESQVFIDNLVK